MKQMLHTKALVVRESVGATQAGVIDQIVGSTPVIDRMGDIIDQAGWNLKNYKDNPVILWGHNIDEDRPPIARAIKVWLEGKGNDAKLMFKVQFDLADSFAADIYRKIKEGFINTVSVGFIPSDWEELEPGNFWGGLRYIEQELLELSFVCVPANPQAHMGLRSFAKKDPRFTPIDEQKLFAPVKKKEILTLLNLTEEKVQEIDVDPNATVGEDGSVNSDTGGGGETDTIETKPDGTELPYTHSTNIGELTASQMGEELNMALAYCAEQTADATKQAKDNENPTDPYNALPGMGNEDMLPAADMTAKEMTVGHMRSLATDVFGDWMSNLNSTSNEGTDVNDYAFSDADTKEMKVAKTTALIELLQKSGRVLSGKNENRIKNAIDLLNQVVAELQEQEQEEEKEPNEAKTQAVEETPGVIAYTEQGITPEGEVWDGPGEKAKATAEDLNVMCAWFDHTKADDKNAYKLVHHQADGEHKAVWRGVASAMASLLGSRGGVDIPAADRKGVYEHLVKHYQEFAKEAPDFKMIEDQVLAGLDDEVWALTLEREEKHMTRLIKKVLENQKAERKAKDVSKPEVIVEEKEVVLNALRIIESALTKVSSTSLEGGEK